MRAKETGTEKGEGRWSKRGKGGGKMFNTGCFVRSSRLEVGGWRLSAVFLAGLILELV